MPRIVNYSDRFDQIREAVVVITARDGVGAVSVASVASQLRMSRDTIHRLIRSADVLPLLGLQWVASNRRVRRRWRLVLPELPTIEGRWQAAATGLREELPITDEALIDSMAWTTLSLACREPAARRLVGENDEHVDHTVCRALCLLDLTPERHERERLRLRALVVGLIEEVCTRRATLDEAIATLDLHLDALAADLVPGVASDQAS